MAKTKALISFAVTTKLICTFVFAYANCWFSHEVAHTIYCGLRFKLQVRVVYIYGHISYMDETQELQIINSMTLF